MTQASPIGRPVTNEDILAELRDWNGDVQKLLTELGELRQAVRALQGRVAALEASRR